MFAAHPHGSRPASCCVSSLEFLSLYASADRVGRERLLDGSSGRGDLWLRRVPSAIAAGDETPPFAFHEPVDFVTALALDLRVCPPLFASAPCCLRCSEREHAVVDLDRWGDGRSHFPSCPVGVRCATTAHDPVVRMLTYILDGAFGPSRVLAERVGDRRALDDWRSTIGSSLPKRPDIVLCGLDGPSSWVIIDVKTAEHGCPTYLGPLSSHSVRDAVHLRKQEESRADYFGQWGGHAPPDERLSLVTFSVSTGGSLGPEASDFLRRVAVARGCAVPPALLSDASWATPVFSVFARMAIGVEVRRAQASALRLRSGTRAAALAASGHRPPPPPPPPPLPAPFAAPAPGPVLPDPWPALPGSALPPGPMFPIPPGWPPAFVAPVAAGPVVQIPVLAPVHPGPYPALPPPA